jgi:hypothetical protein
MFQGYLETTKIGPLCCAWFHREHALGKFVSLIPFRSLSILLKTRGAGPVDLKALLPCLAQLVTSRTARPDFIISQSIGIENTSEYYRRFGENLESKVIIKIRLNGKFRGQATSLVQRSIIENPQNCTRSFTCTT